MTESLDDYDEEDLVRAFAKISNNRRASAVTIGEACRQIWRQDTRYKDYLDKCIQPPFHLCMNDIIVFNPYLVDLV